MSKGLSWEYIKPRDSLVEILELADIHKYGYCKICKHSIRICVTKPDETCIMMSCDLRTEQLLKTP